MRTLGLLPDRNVLIAVSYKLLNHANVRLGAKKVKVKASHTRY